MSLLTSTNPGLNSTAILFLRLMTGLILFVAGAGKVMGWFGGFGMTTTIGLFGQSGFAPFWVYLSSYAELVGGFLLMLGLFTRPAAFVLFINMLVAVVTTGTKNFFMGGAAYPCLLMVASMTIMISGPLHISLDHFLFSRKKH